MVGFIADYAGGEINLQDEELSSGDFYTRDNLPELPRKLSLARKMIDWWIEHPNEYDWFFYTGKKEFLDRTTK